MRPFGKPYRNMQWLSRHGRCFLAGFLLTYQRGTPVPRHGNRKAGGGGQVFRRESLGRNICDGQVKWGLGGVSLNTL